VTEVEVDAIHESAYEDWNGQNIDRALIANTCESVARRRALAELRAIRDAYPEETRALHERIAAIEAEEA
jgi:hypothetical protein